MAKDFHYDAETHIYTLKDRQIPSVTQLLEEFGLIDFSMVPPAILERKKRLGTAVHLACEYFDNHELDWDTLHPEIKPYVEAYAKFCEVTGFESTVIEQSLISRKWGFAGTLDRYGDLDGVPTLLDLKCVWKMYKATGPQLSGYEILLNEDFGLKVKQRIGLQLKPNGNYRPEKYKDKTDVQDFLHCVSLHWQKRNKYQTTKGVTHGINDEG